MLMKFTKMHGIGNDYIYVDCFKETVAVGICLDHAKNFSVAYKFFYAFYT